MGREQYKKEWEFCGIAQAGVYAATVKVSFGSSSSRASVTTYDPRLRCEVGNLIEGGVVVDKRTVSSDDLIHYVVAGAMLDLDLPAGHCKGWGDIEPCEDAKARKGFDFVSLDLYLKLWRSLGARIGVRKGDEIHWEDGRVWQIPSVEERYMVNGVGRTRQDEWKELGIENV
jgi:hypothetical protein